MSRTRRNPRRVLITGGAGYIGSHAAWACVDAGYEVFVVDNLSNGDRRFVPPQAVFEERCISDDAAIRALIERHDIGAMMHFAGFTVVPESIERPFDYYGENTVKSWALFRAAVETGLDRIIFSSTAAVYGGSQAADGRVDEAAATAPASPYGWSKLMTEQVLRDVAAAHGVDFAILRYFNVAGADADGRTGQSGRQTQHLLKVACQTALGVREEMPIYGDDYVTRDGTCVRDFIHVSDLADAHVSALRLLIENGGGHTLNCGYGRGATVLEVIAAVERATGRPLPARRAPRRPGDVPIVLADNTRILDALDWRPTHDDLDLIVSSALGWEERLLRAAA